MPTAVPTGCSSLALFCAMFLVPRMPSLPSLGPFLTGPSRSADDAAFGAFTAPALGGAGGPVAPDHTLSQRLEHLPDMVAGVMSHDPAMQLEATTQFRKLLSIEKNPPIQHVIQAGVVPRFVEFLQVRFPPFAC